jgi:hypothetical protein
MPGNVYLVMNNLASLASFDFIQAGTIIYSMFSFSDTESPGIGFESMGNSTKRIIPYLGMSFLILLLIGAQYLCYGIAYALKNKFNVANKVMLYLKKSLFWNQFLLFLIESYLDLCIGILLSLEQPMF